MPFLRSNGVRQVAHWQLPGWDKRDVHRCRVPDDFGEQPNDVVEVSRCPQATVVPSRVSSRTAHSCPWFTLSLHAAVHCRTNLIKFHHDQRIKIVVERIAERRHEDDCTGWSGLVMVVHDLREPFAVKDAIDVRRFRHVAHEEVPVVVVADVFVPETGNAIRAAL